MKKWQIVLIVLFVIGLISAIYVWKYVYNKPHPDYEIQKADFTLTAQNLFSQFKAEKVKAQQMYNGKMLQITGKLNKIENKDTIAIAVFVFSQGDFGDEGIRCTLLPKFNPELNKISSGSDITIKGYCSGYNDSDVELIKCSIVK